MHSNIDVDNIFTQQVIAVVLMQRVQDPGIGNMFPGKYPPYDDGMKDDVFIHNATGGVLVGQVLCHMLIVNSARG